MKVYNENPIAHQNQNVAMLLVLIVFVMISIASSAKNSLTLDEYLHYQYGVKMLGGDSTRFDDSKMPISVLNALPSGLAFLLPDGLWKVALERFAVARLVTILVSTLVAYLVFTWSRSLYGFVPALFSLLLYVFDPNIIAYSQLVTTDLYNLGAVCLTFYRLWLFANQRTLKNGLLFLMALGISQIIKYTAIALFPLCLIALVIYDWHDIHDSFPGVDKLKQLSKRYIGYILAAIVAAILMINAGFLFNRTFTRFGDYQFRSAPFIVLQKNAALQQMPIPVPYPYLEGLDWMIDTEQSGNRYGNLYLLGQLSKPRGFLGYYFIAALLKIPIASQIIMILSLVLYIAGRDGHRNFLRNELFLLTPVVFFTIYFNFFFNTQIGIRYYLVMFPLLYVFSGNLFVGWEIFPAFKKTWSVVLIAYVMASTLAYFPYYIPYFNEIVWDKTQTYKYLSDSNLDWGQGQIYLEEYLSGHPDAVYSPDRVQAGTLVVGGSDLVGILENPNRYAWLREHFEPVDTVAYTYFVYQISPQEIAKLCTSADLCGK
jgi:4-amino-4-deoxy-L-arabinose transferase-like glycosyltransferase